MANFRGKRLCRYDMYLIDEDGDEIDELPVRGFPSKEEAIAYATSPEREGTDLCHIVCIPLGDDDDPDFREEWEYNGPDCEPWEVVWSSLE